MPNLRSHVRIALKNILLITDFSPASVSALPFALAFARLYEAKLLVAHVVAAEPHSMVVTDRLAAEDDQDLRPARKSLEVYLRRGIGPCLRDSAGTRRSRQSHFRTDS
jgi:nucleotide-binding universal stress UspA family protein